MQYSKLAKCRSINVEAYGIVPVTRQHLKYGTLILVHPPRWARYLPRIPHSVIMGETEMGVFLSKGERHGVRHACM